MWFQHSFERIIKEDLRLTLSEEQVKQLKNRYEGDYDGVYRIGVLCSRVPNPTLAVSILLTHPEMADDHIADFCALCAQKNVTGAKTKKLLAEFVAHKDIDKLVFEQTSSEDYRELVTKKITEHQAKIKAAEDKSKMVNFLIGQVMKEISDKGSVDVGSLKELIKGLL